MSGDPENMVRENSRKYAEEYDDFGNSVSNLRENLKLTPMERLIKAQSAANSLLKIKNYEPKPRD